MTVLTHKEAAAFLKVNEATLRKLRRQKVIYGTLVGAQYRYLQEHLEAYLRGPVPSSSEEILESALAYKTVTIDPPKRRVHHRGVYALSGGTGQ